MAEREGRAPTHDDIHAAIMAGPLPIRGSHGTGAEVMQRIAVPMVGDMISSAILTTVIIPAIYAVRAWGRA
jgi:Cu(I)/Ag(I) efflux system membrane protein CusA/SilA